MDRATRGTSCEGERPGFTPGGDAHRSTARSARRAHGGEMEIDRVQLAVTNRAQAGEPFRRLLGAETVTEDAVAPLAARRTTLALGSSEIELLEPDGTGPVATHIGQYGPGLFAAGLATSAIGELRARLVARSLSFAETGEQLLCRQPPPATVACAASSRRSRSDRLSAS